MVLRIQHINEDGVEKKWCGKCKSFVSVENFNNCAKTWDKLRPTCKTCLSHERLDKKEKITEYNKLYWEKTKDAQSEKNKKWREENIEHRKEYNKAYRALYGKEIDKRQYQKRKDDPEYKEKYNNYRKHYDKYKRKNDPSFRVKENVKRRIRELLQNTGKLFKTHHYLGCSIEQLKCHLEKRFQEGMTWQNYGISWHIDHIIPCASFDFRHEFDKRLCFNYRNLQPLWAKENISKSDNFCHTKKSDYIREFIFYQF